MGSPEVDHVPEGLKRRWPDIRPEDRTAVAAVLERGVLGGVGAPEMTALEREWAAFVGRSDCLLFNSGTAAIHAALYALGIGEGDEVITTAYTFAGTWQPILHQGAIPVFVDIDPRTFDLDPARIEERITPGRGPSSRCTSAVFLPTSTRSPRSPPATASPSSRMPARPTARRTTVARSARSVSSAATASTRARSSPAGRAVCSSPTTWIYWRAPAGCGRSARTSRSWPSSAAGASAPTRATRSAGTTGTRRCRRRSPARSSSASPSTSPSGSATRPS